jgi:hypothetical protein
MSMDVLRTLIHLWVLCHGFMLQFIYSGDTALWMQRCGPHTACFAALESLPC